MSYDVTLAEKCNFFNLNYFNERRFKDLGR